MGLKFRKSFKVAPGVRVNVGKRGIGASVGVKGLRYSVNSSGQRRTTASIPGTGISYSSTSGSRRNYKSSSYQRQRELEKQRKAQDKLQELERNRIEVELFENRLEMIKSIHKESDDPVDWKVILGSEPPFRIGEEEGPLEKAAALNLEKYRPGFFAKLFKQDEKKREELEEEILKARDEDRNQYENWTALVKMADRITSGDIDAYFEVIDEFAPLDDLTEFGSGFEFFAESPDCMEVEFDVHTNDIIPKEVKSLTKTGKISVKNMPISKFYDIQQDYVCSCTLRIARDMFALLPIGTVIIHAVDDQLDSSTGHSEKLTILSVKIKRSELEGINFDLIDCSDSMANFDHRMKFRKTKGFAPVERIAAE
ncbi:DUF4236 domain-containing protein [Bacillus tianshenii]|uniref:DUF4236 domain-containing protein n=1 Tax=Sutcliffiella tianshenii TaxID=1463404 RepID=UPI001CD5E47B|nr:DUF4236 domain-containing protein [Bacillus tianshenii]MCA1322222.1 DUF4236 domain-containing protein [Bacillus tianshenii]